MDLTDRELCPCGNLVLGFPMPPDNVRKFTCTRCGLMRWQGSTSTWADQEAFDYRKTAHKMFDEVRKAKKLSVGQMYVYLASKMKLTTECHFGWMSKPKLMDAIELMADLKEELNIRS